MHKEEEQAKRRGVTLIGVGMGDPQQLSAAALAALREADCLVGSARALETARGAAQAAEYPEIRPCAIAALLRDHPQYRRVCVLYSGDVGFYSGAAGLYPLLEELGLEVKSICGVSSVQLLAARLHLPWQGFHLVSGHGRTVDPAMELSGHQEVFFLTDGKNTPRRLCMALCAAGLEEVEISVGENLSYPQERVTTGAARELAQCDFAPLSVVLARRLESPCAARVTPGIPDSAFIRGGVPMTKCEVRAVALSKLGLCEDEILYDVGAGTGSVAVEAALLLRRGHVYAIEEKEEALQLIGQNRARFGALRLTCVAGAAPQALEGLPPPDAAFIGGTGGRLREILARLLGKNPSVRVTVSAVTLETLQGAVELMERWSFQDIDVVQVSVSKARQAGKLHLMQAQNPVYLISGRAGNL